MTTYALVALFTAMTRHRVVAAAALFAVVAASSLGATPRYLASPLRFDVTKHYVTVAAALQDGWPTPLLEASCPHLYMRTDGCDAAHPTGTERMSLSFKCIGQAFCAHVPADRRGGFFDVWTPRVGRWPRSESSALWLMAQGAQASCIEATTSGSTAAAWAVVAGDGARMLWRARDETIAAWAWPLERDALPTDPHSSDLPRALRGAENMRHEALIVWPKRPAHVTLCGPALVRAEKPGPPEGWAFGHGL